MKKKLFFTVSALVCILLCAFCFAACNKKEGEVSTEVTATEWAAATERFGSSTTYTFTLKGDGYTTACEADATNGRYFITTTEGSSVTKEIYAKEGEEYYYYTQNAAAQTSAYACGVQTSSVALSSSEASWKKQRITKAEYDRKTGLYVGMVVVVSGASDKFDSFTYDEESKRYVAENVTLGNSGAADRIVAGFEDGKLVFIEVKGFLATGETDKIDCTYSDVGSTEVTLPTAETDPKMSASEWQACLTALANGKNLSLKQEVIGSVVGAMKLDGDKYYQTAGTNEGYYSKDNDEYFIFYKYNGAWVKTDITASEYNETVQESAGDLITGAAGAFGAYYNLFTVSNGKYVASTLAVTQDFTLKDIEVTVSDGAITKVVCVWVGDGDDDPDRTVTVDGIGSASVVLPQATAFIPNSPVGHTFVLQSVELAYPEELDNWSPEVQAKIEEALTELQQGINSTLIFGADKVVSGTCDLGYGVRVRHSTQYVV